VTPDVEVDNLPYETFNGRDRQLEVALELLPQEIEGAAGEDGSAPRRLNSIAATSR
jgi:C-terminal processing protease CtpA/Prc